MFVTNIHQQLLKLPRVSIFEEEADRKMESLKMKWPRIQNVNNSGTYWKALGANLRTSKANKGIDHSKSGETRGIQGKV